MAARALSLLEQADLVGHILLDAVVERDGANVKMTAVFDRERIDALQALAARLRLMAPHEQAIRAVVTRR